MSWANASPTADMEMELNLGDKSHRFLPFASHTTSRWPPAYEQLQFSQKCWLLTSELFIDLQPFPAPYRDKHWQREHQQSVPKACWALTTCSFWFLGDASGSTIYCSCWHTTRKAKALIYPMKCLLPDPDNIHPCTESHCQWTVFHWVKCFFRNTRSVIWLNPAYTAAAVNTPWSTAQESSQEIPNLLLYILCYIHLYFLSRNPIKTATDFSHIWAIYLLTTLTLLLLFFLL